MENHLNLEQLIKKLDHKDTRVRVSAARALGQLGQSPAVPALLAMLSDPYWLVIATAADALGDIGSTAKTAVHALMTMPSDPYWLATAADAFGQMGPTAKAAVPALIRLLQHPEAEVRISAAKALEKLQPQDRSSDRFWLAQTTLR